MDQMTTHMYKGAACCVDHLTLQLPSALRRVSASFSSFFSRLAPNFTVLSEKALKSH